MACLCRDSIKRDTRIVPSCAKEEAVDLQRQLGNFTLAIAAHWRVVISVGGWLSEKFGTLRLMLPILASQR